MKRISSLGSIYKSWCILLVVNLLFSSASMGMQPNASTVTAPPQPAYVQDVVLLQVDESTSLVNDPLGRPGHHFRTNSPELERVLSSAGVRSVKTVFPPGQARKAEREGQGGPQLSNTYRLRLTPAADVQALMEALSVLPEVAFAEPDYIATEASLPPQLTINDPLYPDQWGLAKINIEGAWAVTYGSPTISIAVIDSGIDLTHPDLAANLWSNPGEIAGNGVDDDSNGYVDDVRGWNFVSSNNDVSDEYGHGTLVAGVAAAVGGNGQGIVGACPLCRIMPVKVMQNSGAANYSDIAAGVLYAAQKGAKVINLSLGGYANSNTLQNAINSAANTYGAVIVGGAGNDNATTPFYPAAYGNVLAVAGTLNDDTKSATSNYGAWVDVSAPGAGIRSTTLGGGWADASGTSMSAPFAAGLAGLLRALHPDWTQLVIRSQITHTAESIDGLNPSLAGLLGSGRLDAGSAMQVPHPVLSMDDYNVNGQPNGRPVLGATASMLLTLSNDWWEAMGVTGILTTNDTFVTLVTGSAGFGDIPTGGSKTNSTPFSFSVKAGAGYNHPIPFHLAVTDTSGYSNSFDFTVTTESGVVDKSGTILADTTWTNDRTYRIMGNVGIAPNVTLTIQPGTTVKFNGNYQLGVGGILVADGTADQPITFKSNTGGTWSRILFDDTSTDAVADVDGNYLSGSILRYVSIEGSSGGIDVMNATPYLSHITLSAGGINGSLGATPLWLLDSTIAGSSIITGAGSASAIRNSISGGLSLAGTGRAENNRVSAGNLVLGAGNAKRNTLEQGNLSVGGSGGRIEKNQVLAGSITAGSSFQVLDNTIVGSLTAGNSSTVDHNTVSSSGQTGIQVGGSATVTWNSVENAAGAGIAAGGDITAAYNRLVENASGMTASSGLIEHNLIANSTGVGLEAGAATVRYNTLTGNMGNTIVVQGGNPLAIEYNNIEGNTGAYDMEVKIPAGTMIPNQNNWWGTTDTALIDARIFDFLDDYTKAQVSYSPVLTGPDQTAPAYVRGVTVLPDSALGIQTGTFVIEFSRPMNIDHAPDFRFAGPLHNQVSAGYGYTCEVQNNGRLLCWGLNDYGQATPPAGSYLQVSGGRNHTCAVKTDGTIVCWGSNEFGKASPPAGTFVQVSVGSVNSCGIRSDGSGICWGMNQDGLLNLPPLSPGVTFTQISESNYHPNYTQAVTCGVKSNGKAFCLGTSDGADMTAGDVPPGAVFAQVSAGAMYSQGLTTNGKIYLWGSITDPDYPFPGNQPGLIYTQIGGAGSLMCALRGDKTPVCWGSSYAVSALPYARYEQISVGVGHACGLKSDGSLYCGGQTVPDNRIVNTKYQIIQNAQWLSQTHYQASFDITSAIPRDTYRFSVRDAIDSEGMLIAPFSNSTFIVDYAGSITDKTPPSKPWVIAFGNKTLSTLSATWSSKDAESPITKYRYAIGTTPGGRDVVDWTYVDGPSMKHTGLSLNPGVSYYVSAGARNEGGLWSQTGVSAAVVNGIGTLSSSSTALQDGWVLESTESSGVGGSQSATTTTFYVGDDAANRQYRSILSFNTAGLPDNAIITGATFKIRRAGIAGTNPFTTHGNILVDIRKGEFFNNAALQIQDFQAAANKIGGMILTNKPVNYWYSAILAAVNFPYINKTGITQFRLRFKLDDNNDKGADYLKFFSGNYGTASLRPQLIIKYYVP